MRFFVLWVLLSVPVIFPQEGYYYKGKDYGSEALYNPVNLILNGSFDIIQLQNGSRKILSFPYHDGSKNVLKNLGDPFPAIRRAGVMNFIRSEIIPLDLSKKNAQWWPNYQLHLIGGGMTYRAMCEWYRYYKFPQPKIFAGATVAAYHFLNEVLENGSYSGDNTDPIADIYIFDLGGILLFSFDNVAEFFSRDLNLSDWSLQPSINFASRTLQNNGQYFSVKWKIPWQEHFHFFYYFGMNGLTGLSYKFDNGSAVSLGGGLRAKELETVNAINNQKTLKLTWNVGVFYDLNNSLLTSLVISGLTDYSASFNVYPGMLKIGKFSPGLWCVMKQSGSLMLGISTTWFPGISLD